MKAVTLAVVAAIVIVAAGASIFLLGFTPSTSTSGIKTVTLVAENIKFNSTNPTIVVRVGEKVRLNVVNQDNVPHDFAIEALGIRTDIFGPGKTVTVDFTVTTPGTYTYQCKLHPNLMDGQIKVQG